MRRNCSGLAKIRARFVVSINDSLMVRKENAMCLILNDTVTRKEVREAIATYFHRTVQCTLDSIKMVLKVPQQGTIPIFETSIA